MASEELMSAVLCIYSEETSDVGKTVTVTSQHFSTSKSYTIPTGGVIWARVTGGDVYTITFDTYTTEVAIPYGGCAKINVGYSIDTWAGIKRIVDAGKMASYFSPGDQKTIILSTGESVVFDVAGVNTYDGCLDFIAHDCLLNTRQQHTSNTNANGWAASDLKKWLCETFLSYLPEDLQAVITAKNVITSVGSQSTSLQTTECMIWLPTEYELFGKITYAASTEAANHSQYPIFTDDASRIKHLGPNGDPASWWEASPLAGNSAYFCDVTAAGAAGNNNASSAYGVVPGFRIQKAS